MKAKTNKEFIVKSLQVHIDVYDYSLVNYINNKTKVKIVCKSHGEFEQKPSSHLNGQGCPKCGKLKSANSQKLPVEEFIKIASNKHNNLYDYSFVSYNNLDNNIKILCQKHGSFTQRASRHLNDSICSKCNHLNSSNNQKDSKEAFVEKSKKVHGNLFDYSNVLYINNKTKVEIICQKHGSWWQTPVNHIMNKQKCPWCNESKGETLIKQFLINNNIKFEREKTFTDCINIHKLPFDFYLPELNICIEYNGIQHYKPVEYFGGINAIKSQQKRDKIKIKFCVKNNITLLIISYKDNIDKIMQNII